MEYVVVVKYEDGDANLACSTLDEAQRVKQSFINYGKCRDVLIERPKSPTKD